MGKLLDARATMLGDLAEVEKNLGWGDSIPGPKKVILDKAFKRITEGFHNMEGQGIRFTDQDRPMFEQIANPTELFTRDTTVKTTIDAARATLNRAMAAKGRVVFGKENPLGE